MKKPFVRPADGKEGRVELFPEYERFFGIMNWGFRDVTARIGKKVVLLSVFLTSTANGEIYTWIDSRGTAHYVNSLYDVPDRFRARVKIVDTGEKKKDAPTPQPETAQYEQAHQALVATPREVHSLTPAGGQENILPKTHSRIWGRRDIRRDPAAER